VTWAVERTRGSAGEHHRRELPDPVRRAVWVHEVTGSAVVLGSTQPESVVDRARADAAGVEVARRRSGGGAVLVVPGEVLWVDVVLPAGDPLWDDDVGRSFLWLGRAWAAALGSLGVEAAVHQGALVCTSWSRLVCFAGQGSGEVHAAGAKVVGVAQRRTRAGCRFQCAALLAPWDPIPLLDLLALESAERARAAEELAVVARSAGVPGDALLDALLDGLPS
jgi:lipoate-protein ligase A